MSALQSPTNVASVKAIGLFELGECYAGPTRRLVLAQVLQPAAERRLAPNDGGAPQEALAAHAVPKPSCRCQKCDMAAQIGSGWPELVHESIVRRRRYWNGAVDRHPLLPFGVNVWRGKAFIALKIVL
jgi:hypothetical protein